MQQRTLGPDLSVSAIGLGCMTMTGGYSGRPDQAQMINLLHTAVDRGRHRCTSRSGCSHGGTADLAGGRGIVVDDGDR